MKVIKQFGLQRSGTNALKAIIEVNTPSIVLPTTFGNKHDEASWISMDEWARSHVPEAGLDPDVYRRALVDLETRQLFCVFSVKEFASWVASYHRYQAAKAKFRDPSANLSFDQRFVLRSFESWSKVIDSFDVFVADNPDTSLLVQHERLLRAPGEVLAEFTGKSGVACSEHPELFLSGYARRGLESHRGSDLINSSVEFNRAFHLKDEWSIGVPEGSLILARELQEAFLSSRARLADRLLGDVPGVGG